MIIPVNNAIKLVLNVMELPFLIVPNVILALIYFKRLAMQVV